MQDCMWTAYLSDARPTQLHDGPALVIDRQHRYRVVVATRVTWLSSVRQLDQGPFAAGVDAAHDIVVLCARGQVGVRVR